MHDQLELMLEIQDLRAQKASLENESNMREVESDLFDMQVEDAVRVLAEKLDDLEERLETDVRRRYRQLTEKEMRPIVPVLQGICYGCFMAVPTAWGSEAERNERLDICQNCGRFLYHVK